MISLKNDFLIQRLLLLLVLIFPWFALGISYEIYIKELSYIFAFVYLISFASINSKNLSLDLPGFVYFCFILICVTYFAIEIINYFYINNGFNSTDLSFLSHVLVSTILNFVVYFVFFNISIKKSNLKFFLNVFFGIYLLIALYFIFYAYGIQELSKDYHGGYFSYQLESMRNNPNFHFYLGGNNGRSLFLLVLSAFFAGYYQSEEKHYVALLCVSLSLIASYLMMCRSAILFGVVLFFIIFFKFLATFKLKGFLSIILIISFIISLNYYFGLISIDLLASKGLSLSNRDFLIYESLDLAMHDYFIGRGFHSTVIDKPYYYASLGYEFISVNGPQNSFLTILIEMGVIGLVLFSLFFIFSISGLIRVLKFYSKSPERSFMSGTLFLLIWVLFSMIFVHGAEKSFLYFPVYMIIIGTAANLRFNAKMEEK